MKLDNRPPGRCVALILVWTALTLSFAPNAAGQADPAKDAISAEQIETERKAAETDNSLDETQKQKALSLFDQASQWLKQSLEAKAQLTQLETTLQEAPNRLKAIRQALEKPDPAMAEIDATLASGDQDQVETALAQEQVAIQLARERQRQKTDELSRLLVGSKEINEEITARLKTLDQIEADLRNVATDDPPTLVQARTLVLKTRRMLRQSELALFRLRLENQELLTNLAQAERDLAAAEIIAHQTRLDALNQALQRLGEARAEQVRQESEVRQRQIEALPQPLQNIANENGQYRLEHETLAEQGRAVTNRLQTAQLGLDEIKSDFERTRERVDVVGATQAIGKLLKRRRDALPSLQSYRRTSAERGKEISRATDRQIEIDELLSERADRKVVISKTLALLSEAEVTVYEQSVADLVREQRDLLNELQKVYARYVGQITALDLAERQLVEVASEYTDYIDDQLIWIPGLGLASLLDPAGFAKAVAWLLAPSRWLEVAQDLLTLLQQRGIWSLMVLGLFLVLLSNRQKSLNRLREIAQETRKISTDSFKLTLWALLHTWVAIGAWPVLLIGIGWLLASLPTAATHTLLMANGLLKMGLILASVLLLIQICLPDSLGDRHLRWPQKIRESLVHELRWIIPIVLPLGFVVGATAGSEPPQAVQSFGRLAFVALMLVSSLFIFRLLRSRGTIMQTLTNGKGSLLVQLHFLWFPVLMVTPVIFAFTSALGYHYTAVHLEQRAEQTFWFFFGLFLLKELLLRSLYIADRRLRYEDALRRRDELRAQRAQADEAKSEETSVGSLEIPEIDFAELGEQNKRLVRAGFLFATVIGIWSIWSDLLPALGFLNSTELPLHATRIVDGISKEVPVTLADLTLGLIMVVITVLAAKNIPGVLEITLLQRLPLDSGARYAITSLTQYLIAGIGVFIAFSTLGLQWSNIQWLVAALSVGLGFGLQEIVANFISGIILLFERPIRVGDVVTIDNITGKVSRIRIRATTIINWDKQELLIPNKEFITGRVINWTLTDKINRIVINVGVAYGSNVERAMQLMLEAADENENVLTDPEPVVTFEGFGDNALTLVLRSYLGSMDNRLVTITALHRAINAKFNAAGINIAFPQRDIHLSADQPLDIRLHRDPP